MKRLATYLALVAMVFQTSIGFAAGKLQNQDFKSLAELTAAGATASSLLNDTKVYITANGVNDQLSNAITNGLLGGSGSGVGIELLPNPGFESGGATTNWSSSGGVVATNTSGVHLLVGKKSAQWTPSASGQTFTSSALAIAGLAGQNCSAQIYYTYAGTSGDYSLQAYDGTSVLAALSLPSQSVANPQSITFPCGSATTSTLQWRLISNVASPSAIYFDNAHLGSIGLYQIANESDWVSYTPTVTNLPTITLNGVWRRVGDAMEVVLSGRPNGASTGQITFSIPSGYTIDSTKLTAVTSTYQSAGSLGTANALPNPSATQYYIGSVGYNSSTAVTVIDNNTTAGNYWGSSVPAAWGGGGGALFSVRFTVPIVGWSTALQTAYRPDAGGLAAGDLVQTASSSCPIGTLAMDGSAVSRTAYAALFAAIGTTYGVGDGSTTFNLPDGRGIFLRGAGSQTIGGITYTGTQGTSQGDALQGHYHANSNLSGTGEIPYKRGSGGVYNDPFVGGTVYDRIGPSGNIGGTISSDGTNGTPRTGAETRPANISVLRCIRTVAASPAPLLVNSVTSSSPGVERIERATVAYGSPCSTATCTIAKQTGAFSSITRQSAGNYTANFVAGSFSSPPSCFVMPDNVNNVTGVRMISGATTSAFQWTCLTAQDCSFEIMCMGPH